MHLLIDLDGTLTDPFPGITKCIQHALAALGRPFPSAENLRWCIGPPLRQSLVTLLGRDHEHLADEARLSASSCRGPNTQQAGHRQRVDPALPAGPGKDRHPEVQHFPFPQQCRWPCILEASRMESAQRLESASEENQGRPGELKFKTGSESMLYLRPFREQIPPNVNRRKTQKR